MKRKAHLRLAPTLLAEAFVLLTAVNMALDKDLHRLLFAGITAGLLLMPFCLERLLEKELSLPLLLFFQLYALGPMLGKCWRLYQSVPFWDKLLHFTGGVVFALVGLWLWEWKIGDGKRLWAALFGLCFSVFISAAWEIGEFAADLLFGLDSQADTILSEIRSAALGKSGEVGVITGIDQMALNGKALPLRGYLDIGLFDTMWDMIVETLGALITVAVFLLRKKKGTAK